MEEKDMKPIEDLMGTSIEKLDKLLPLTPLQQQCEASILLYNLCMSMGKLVSSNDFDIIRPDWNEAMDAHEQAIKRCEILAG